MCCTTTTGKHHGTQRMGHHQACFCGCREPHSFQRRFMTQKQQITRMEAYLKDLQEETKAVEEEIGRLKKQT